MTRHQTLVSCNGYLGTVCALVLNLALSLRSRSSHLVLEAPTHPARMCISYNLCVTALRLICSAIVSSYFAVERSAVLWSLGRPAVCVCGINELDLPTPLASLQYFTTMASRTRSGCSQRVNIAAIMRQKAVLDRNLIYIQKDICARRLEPTLHGFWICRIAPARLFTWAIMVTNCWKTHLVRQQRSEYDRSGFLKRLLEPTADLL